MITLGIDTSGPAAGAALTKDGRLLAETTCRLGLTHSQTIMPIIEGLFDLAHIQARDVGLIACVAGPGSFTGVRLGVCAAKGIALATGAKCARINALETLAAGCFGFDVVICPILDARRGQVYGAAFRYARGDRPERIRDDAALALSDYLNALPDGEKCLFNGDGLAAHRASIEAQWGDRALFMPDALATIRASFACALAENAPDEWMEGDALTPIYLRAPQAERERAARGETNV